MDNALTAFVEVFPEGERSLAAAEKTAPVESLIERPKDAIRRGPPVRKPAGVVIRPFVHPSTGKRIARKALLTTVENIGQRAASKALGIPRTTLQRWVKKAA
jgi:transcriptional regulator of acetoin/glycerol metabolism